MSQWKIACGHVFVFGMIVVSILMNFRFGYLQGSTDWDAWVYGLAAGLADCIKALLPLVVVAAWRNQKYAGALAASMIFAALTSYSFISGIGFAALNRAVTVGARTAEVDGYQLTKRRLEDAEKRLAALQQGRAIGVVQAEMTATLKTPVLRRNKSVRGTVAELTSGCTKSSRWSNANEGCEKFRALQQELAVAQEGEQLRLQIDTLSQQLVASMNKGKGTIGQSDPQASTIHGLTGVPMSTVKMVLALATGMIVELVSGLGLFIFGLPIVGTMKQEKKEPKPPSGTPSNSKQDGTAAKPTTLKLPNLRMIEHMPSKLVH